MIFSTFIKDFNSSMSLEAAVKTHTLKSNNEVSRNNEGETFMFDEVHHEEVVMFYIEHPQGFLRRYKSLGGKNMLGVVKE